MKHARMLLALTALLSLAARSAYGILDLGNIVLVLDHKFGKVPADYADHGRLGRLRNQSG